MANPKSRKWRRIVVVSAVVLVVVGTAATVWWRKREVAIVVQAERVTRRNLTEIVVANGRIQPVLQVKISPEVSGEIIELPVKEGQQVNKGDLLLKIKPDYYAANKRSAQASYESASSGKDLAEANLRKAQAEFRRAQGLYGSHLISEQAFEEAQTALEVAVAQAQTAKHQVNVAKASLDRAQEELAKTTIYSPLTGTVSKLNSELGERVVGTAMMTGTEVMTIADLNEMEARVDIGEVDVVLIAPNQLARLEVDAFHDRKFRGVVTEIANSSKMGAAGGSGGQEATKFEVKIRIQEKEVFRPGMTVTAEVETRYRTNVLSVPIQSVTTRLPKKPATVAKAGAPECPEDCSDATTATKAETGQVTAHSSTNKPGLKKPAEPAKPIEVLFAVKGDRAVMVPVKRGISDDAYMEITEGVTEGQEIVSGGYKAISRDLEDGKKIKVAPAKTETNQEKVQT